MVDEYYNGKHGLTGDEKSEYQREYIRVWWFHFIDYFRWLVGTGDFCRDEILEQSAVVAHNGGFEEE